MVVVGGEPEGCETTERGSWRKGGKRRKQKAIAYERQLAPLMARETKQKGEASSNTIKPTVCAPLARASRKEEEEVGRERREIKNPGGNNGARATASRAAVAVCRCPTPLSLLSPFPRLSFSLVSCRFSRPFFPLFFSSFLLFTADNAAVATASEWLEKTRFGKLKIANEARGDASRARWCLVAGVH